MVSFEACAFYWSRKKWKKHGIMMMSQLKIVETYSDFKGMTNNSNIVTNTYLWMIHKYNKKCMSEGRISFEIKTNNKNYCWVLFSSLKCVTVSELLICLKFYLFQIKFICIGLMPENFYKIKFIRYAMDSLEDKNLTKYFCFRKMLFENSGFHW